MVLLCCRIIWCWTLYSLQQQWFSPKYHHFTAVKDWYDQQTLGLDNDTIYWRTIAPRPTDNIYAIDRNGEGDAINIAVVDDDGSITGIKANILEKFVALSKGADSVSNVDSPRKITLKSILQTSPSISTVEEMIIKLMEKKLLQLQLVSQNTTEHLQIQQHSQQRCLGI